MPVALAALIMATEAADDDREGLRATLPLVGRTLVEHQARQAVRAGAKQIVILVERMPPALIAAIDRLRRDGLAVDIARTVGDAADRFHPDEALLLFADGAVIDEGVAQRIAAMPPPTLGTVPDVPGREAFERIDAGSRWAGIALLDGVTMRETAAMLGQWDLQSTLLRRAAQAGARRTDAAGPSDAAALPRIVRGTADLDGIDRWLLETSVGGRGSWVERWLFVPIEKVAVAGLVQRPVDAQWLALGAAALAVLGGGFLLVDLLWPGLVLLLLSGPLATTARRLASTRLATVRQAGLLRRIRATAASIGLLGQAVVLADGVDWTWLLLALAVIGAAVATAMLRPIAAALGHPQRSLWLAALDPLIWLALPFAAGGWRREAVAALALYALGSAAWLLWRAHGAARDSGGVGA